MQSPIHGGGVDHVDKKGLSPCMPRGCGAGDESARTKERVLARTVYKATYTTTTLNSRKPLSELFARSWSNVHSPGKKRGGAKDVGAFKCHPYERHVATGRGADCKQSLKMRPLLPLPI